MRRTDASPITSRRQGAPENHECYAPLPGHPVRGKFQVPDIFSLAIAILMAISSVMALLNPEMVYPNRDLVRAFLANDVANLAVGLPALLFAMWLARRGALAGLLLWPGSLLYVQYNYLVPLLCAPFNQASAIHLALVTISLYTTMALVAAVSESEVKERLAGFVPEKLGGAAMVVLAIVTLARTITLMATHLHNGSPIGATDLALAIADTLMAPAWLIGGILLWKRSSFGYLAAPGLLLEASMLFAGLIVFLIVQQLITGAGTGLAGPLMIGGMGLIVFIPFGLFLRGMARRGCFVSRP